jgi:hypothetical protein
MYWLRGVALLAALALAGCGRGQPDVAPEDTETRLKDTIDIDAGAWLKLSRAELAKLIDEYRETVSRQHSATQDDSTTTELLPRLNVPLTVPVLQEATFTDGVSIPPYVKPGAHDRALALHLARFGDHEAALRFADPADSTLRARLDALRLPRNYPVEWTRLVGLAQLSAQLKLAGADPDGAAELVGLHKQLRKVLDAKAAGGPLGSALLSAGHRALELSVDAYRLPRFNKPALAEDIQTALGDWGKVPAPTPALALGASKRAVARLLGVPARGKAVTVQDRPAITRALDVYGLPLPRKGAVSVVAFLDGKNRFRELMVVYRSRIERVYPEPVNLAHHLGDLGFSSDPLYKSAGLQRQTWTGGGLAYQATRVLSGHVAGALLRVRSPKGPTPAAFAQSGRDFGPVSLDLSFETDRVNVAPDQSGKVLEVRKRKELARLVKSLGAPVPASAVLKREPNDDLLANLTLTWPAEQNPGASAQLLPALWSAFGSPRVEAIDDSGGGSLTFSWDDGKTNLLLRCPFNDRSPDLTVDDVRGPATLEQRAKAARKRDRDDRKARLKAGNPTERLARSVGGIWELLDGVRLGQTRAEAEAALPRRLTIRQRTIPGGVSLLVTGEPADVVAFFPRQAFVRFGADDRVAEIRVRCQVDLPTGERKRATLLKTLEQLPAGKPVKVSADWTGLWSDVGTGKRKPVKYLWQDDRTVLTYQRDAGGAEVILRDRPLDQPEGVALAPLQFCSRGVDGCNVGDSREEVRKAMKGAPGRSGDAEVYRLPSSSPYDYVLVWYRGDKVERVVAAQRASPGTTQLAINAALQAVWRKNLDPFGFVRRQVGRQGEVFGRYFWHDDRTRVQSWVQEGARGPQLFVEWRDWPLPGTKKIRTARR